MEAIELRGVVGGSSVRGGRAEGDIGQSRGHENGTQARLNSSFLPYLMYQRSLWLRFMCKDL